MVVVISVSILFSPLTLSSVEKKKSFHAITWVLIDHRVWNYICRAMPMGLRLLDYQKILYGYNFRLLWVDRSFLIFHPNILETEWRLVMVLMEGIVALPIFKQEARRCTNGCFCFSYMESLIVNLNVASLFLMNSLGKSLSESGIALLGINYYRFWHKMGQRGGISKFELFSFLSNFNAALNIEHKLNE